MQGDPGTDRDRQHERAEQRRQDARSTGERERERDKAGGPARLRDGHGVGEVRKNPDEQLDPEDRQGPAEHECGPALAGREGRQRHR